MQKNLKNYVKKISKIYGYLVTLPFRLIKNQISSPENIQHSKWVDYLSQNFNKNGFRILEIGSRNVTGVNLREKFCNAEYIGFDFYDGENVGFKAKSQRFKKARDGWLFNQAILIADILGYANQNPIEKIKRLNFNDRLWLILNARQLRRSLLDQFAFAFLVLIYIKK